MLWCSLPPDVGRTLELFLLEKYLVEYHVRVDEPQYIGHFTEGYGIQLSLLNIIYIIGQSCIYVDI